MSVSRAQSSWEGVGDKEVVISQVDGSVPMQSKVDNQHQGGDLQLDALPHWKPVQLTGGDASGRQ